MGSNSDPEPPAPSSLLPFWQFNIAPSERQTECPEPLRHLSAKDIRLIGMRDEDYHVQSWAEVVDIVRTGRLADFRRWPTELRRYREFVWRLNNSKQNQHEGTGREGGCDGVMAHILRNRLHWTEEDLVMAAASKLHSHSSPFACPDDYKILWNDWPYGIDRRIVHLVVWTKFELQDDEQTEDEIERFIERTFLSVVAQDKVSLFPPTYPTRICPLYSSSFFIFMRNIGAFPFYLSLTRRGQKKKQLIWFKNPPSLKSIHAVEHIHVMLFDPDPEAIDRLTNGDRPQGQLLVDPVGHRRQGQAKNGGGYLKSTARALM